MHAETVYLFEPGGNLSIEENMKCLSFTIIASLLLTGSAYCRDCNGNGKNIFLRLAQERDIGPTIAGAAGKKPFVAIYIEDVTWVTMSEDDRHALAEYMPCVAEDFLTGKVYKDPIKTLKISKSNLDYKKIERKIGMIDPGKDWIIYAGRATGDGRIIPDQAVLAGKK